MYTVPGSAEFVPVSVCKVLVWACRCVDEDLHTCANVQMCGAILDVQMCTIHAGCYWV